jgi:hypothetical protein
MDEISLTQNVIQCLFVCLLVGWLVNYGKQILHERKMSQRCKRLLNAGVHSFELRHVFCAISQF